MGKPEFDQYSKKYNSLVDEAVGVTGFDTGHFVTAKLEKLRKLFPGLAHAPANFLDFGCGTGNLYEHFHDYFPAASYVGTDLSDEMVRQAQSKFPNSNAFFEIHSAGWKQSRFDIIFASCVFHHIPPPRHKKILKELSDLLTGRGKLILWEHNPLNPFTRWIVHQCPFDEDAVLIPPGKIKRMFREIPLARVQLLFTTFFPNSLRFLIPLEPFLEWLPLGGQYLIMGENQEGEPHPPAQK